MKGYIKIRNKDINFYLSLAEIAMDKYKNELKECQLRLKIFEDNYYKQPWYIRVYKFFKLDDNGYQEYCSTRTKIERIHNGVRYYKEAVELLNKPVDDDIYIELSLFYSLEEFNCREHGASLIELR